MFNKQGTYYIILYNFHGFSGIERYVFKSGKSQDKKNLPTADLDGFESLKELKWAPDAWH
jgi:hypothetical protein